jgi:hypothetical protein
VTISGTALKTPGAIAFDFMGWLWVSNGAANTILMFGSGALASGGTPAPATTLTGPVGATFQGLAFDDTLSTLWTVAASGSARTLQSYSTSGGAATFSAALPGTWSGFTAIAFDPLTTTTPLTGP